MLLLDGAEGTRKIGAQAAADGLYGLMSNRNALVGRKWVVQPGWYRIGTYYAENNDSPATESANVRISIKRDFNNNSNESHEIYLLLKAGSANFKSIYDLSSNYIIDKIRYVSKINKATLDIHYSSEGKNAFTIVLENIISGNTRRWSLEDFGELISDEVISDHYAIHTFKANSWLGSDETWPLF